MPPETPRTWTLSETTGLSEQPIIEAWGDPTGPNKVEVIEKAPVEAAHAAERERMLDLIERLLGADMDRRAAEIEAADLLQEHGRLSGGEGA